MCEVLLFPVKINEHIVTMKTKKTITLKMIAILKLYSFFYSLFETNNVSVISLTAEKAMPKYINPAVSSLNLDTTNPKIYP